MSKKRRLKRERSLEVDGSKGLKRSSAAASRTPTSKLTNTKIDDLPDQVLIDILCRLPSCKLVHPCKLVSRRWRTLISDHHFIRQFLHLKHKQTPAVTHTLISRYGEEFLSRMSSSHKPLRRLFEKLKSFHHWEHDPVVVDTFNDLVLCCPTERYESDYYICNPFTNQFVALPPPPEVFKHVHVGFICDRPYYNCKKDNQGGDVIELNTEYNYKVVRLIRDYDAPLLTLDEFNVHIFSSDTGEWREFILSSSSERSVRDIHYNPRICNGMLYWMGSSEDYDEQFVIGLDPFMIENTNSSTTRSSISGDDFTDHIYQCPFIEIGGGRYQRRSNSDEYSPCLGVNGGGCLRLAHFDQSMSLDVCDVNVNQTARINGEGAAGKRSEEIMNNYSLDKKRIPLGIAPVDLLAFDPSDGDVLFCWMKRLLNKDIVMSCNIRTGALSEIDDQTKRRICLPRNKEKEIDLRTEFYPLALPSWPTPLPKLLLKKKKKKKRKKENPSKVRSHSIYSGAA